MKNDNPLVSINIPVYKCEKYIQRCLESVRNQTYKNIEAILVNDSTPDSSIEIVSQFIADHPELNIRIIHHKINQGLSVVRNTGIDNSAGEYIFFLDSDDEITANCIELLVANVSGTNADIVISQNRWINTFDNTTKDFGFPTKASKKFYNNREEIFEIYSNGELPASSWNKLINRKFVVRNKIYFIPGLFAQDELWFFHLLLKTDSLSIIDDITYLYYLHNESVIFNRTKRNFENFLTILDYFSQSYKDEKNPVMRKLILKKIIKFKEMVLIMQWKTIKEKEYLGQNIGKMQKMPKLSFRDYLSNGFSKEIKKKNFFQNLPKSLATKVFMWRFQR